MIKKVLAIILMFLICIPSFAQVNNNHEITSEVKELTQFHKVIYKIWHTGWPNKDISFLVSLVPSVDSGYSKIKNAELPGIMRDKKSKWDEAVKMMGVCVDMYRVSSVKRDSVSVLNAAEKLHSQFENMIRMVRPPVKEVEEFHQVLYMLYHHYMPNGNYEKIKESSAELRAKIDPIKKAELPKRLKPKTGKFAEVIAELTSTVAKLNETVKAEYNKKAVDSEIEKVHTKYVELEKLLE
jgi:hypothetical protein